MKLEKFPVPPSSNKLYSSFRGRLIKSKDGRDYDNKVQTFVLLNKRKIESFKKHVNLLLERGPYLSITTVFVMHKSKVLTKQGRLKKIDVSNRLKALHDAFARAMGIDDCVFVHPIARLATCDDERNEQVIFSLESSDLLRYEEL